MSNYLHNYLGVFFVALVPVVFSALTLRLGKLLRPNNPQLQKSIPYESGSNPFSSTINKSHLIRYYLLALAFVVFDIEAVFLFPWALRVASLGVFGLIEITIFVFILSLGLIYAWRKGVLQWL